MARSGRVTSKLGSTSGKQLLEELSRPGPHPVLRGDLGMVGIPGAVFAPEQGTGLPAVAFGHDWLQPVERYAELLRHLASWGIVAAAPGGHRGPLPSYRQFAADLRATVDVCAGVRLGSGRISVDSRRTALAGHGVGAGAAVLAAADHPKVAALVTLAVSEVRPSAVDAARRVEVLTLHVVAGRDTVAAPGGHAEPIIAATAGRVWQRMLPKATHSGFLDGSHWSDLILAGGPDVRTRKITRALVTGFLLRELAGEQAYAGIVDGDVPGTTQGG